jgi:hypothetical protein
MLLPMALDIERRYTQEIRVVSEQTKPVVAPLAKQAADSA